MSSERATPGQWLPGDVTPVDLERLLWGLVALSLIADIVTTFVGLNLGLAESNPAARGAIESHGVVGMLGLKAFAVGVALACRPLLERAYRPIVPAGLAVPWLAAAVVNMYTISTVLSSSH
ncbi:hypothetical protein C488_13408 [Natrinema pellirubrum DSM 15624]|uniref:DUF5658 domain-containing protein n=1 Tax=Natrinema pellirubrum (strain DSM 15624 / CIP 106293 / JCM 10476 / NCIMB 786 / 157) TaxID=797303 RepID=L0JQK6_NATP1|nr:DUF5658 family protein [Natrinema pellirubrum]AGB32666.1 hypothetical protein Natpe_2868 [Natrinema pellirubrum DSM 15624]ELY73800.1 hypothetical protein C488_13408 [Natrinema pellirubrum DSM 15624]